MARCCLKCNSHCRSYLNRFRCATFSRHFCAESTRRLPSAAPFADASQHAHRTIIHDGYQYKTLADHDPYSIQMADEQLKQRALHQAWHICPNTPEALHVCAAYPWQANALVFDNGSAVGTSARVGMWGEPGQTLCLFGALRRHSSPYHEHHDGFVEADPNWHHMRCNSIHDPDPYPFGFIGRKRPPFVYLSTTFKRLPPPLPFPLPAQSVTECSLRRFYSPQA
jgi:hypothetical protein